MTVPQQLVEERTSLTTTVTNLEASITTLQDQYRVEVTRLNRLNQAIAVLTGEKYTPIGIRNGRRGGKGRVWSDESRAKLRASLKATYDRKRAEMASLMDKEDQGTLTEGERLKLDNLKASFSRLTSSERQDRRRAYATEYMRRVRAERQLVA